MLAAFVISFPERKKPLVILPSATNSPIQVYITGAVNNPGVVSLQKNSRVQDAINSAGGVMDNANLQTVNLAAFVSDGQKILIPSFSGSQNQSQPIEQNTSLPLIHLNSASQKELESLPGIGEEMAKAILAERENRGGFQSIDELIQVSGISRNIFEQIKPYLSLE